MSRFQESEQHVGLATEIGLYAQAVGLIFYRALRHPNTPGHLIIDKSARRVGFEPMGGESREKFQDFDPTKAERYLPGWEYRPTGSTVYGQGRRPEGEFVREGWIFTRTFNGVEYRLDFLSKRPDLRLVSLSTGGISELRLGSIEYFDENPTVDQISFYSLLGSYHIAERGFSHFIQSADRTLSARKQFRE